MIELIYSLIFIGGVISGMGLCYFIMRPPANSPEVLVKRFIKKGKLIPRKHHPVLKLDNDKYLVERGLELVPVEYLRQKYRIETEEEITLEVFMGIASKYLQRIEYDEEGAYVVKGGTDLLRPPEPPKEYPPIPEGWNEI